MAKAKRSHWWEKSFSSPVDLRKRMDRESKCFYEGCIVYTVYVLHTTKWSTCALWGILRDYPLDWRINTLDLLLLCLNCAITQQRRLYTTCSTYLPYNTYLLTYLLTYFLTYLLTYLPCNTYLPYNMKSEGWDQHEQSWVHRWLLLRGGKWIKEAAVLWLNPTVRPRPFQ